MAKPECCRSCTDCSWCFIFLFYLGVCGAILTYGFWKGDPRRLTHGIDYYGRLCGVDPGVEKMPWLYYCGSKASASGMPKAIDTESPSCVAECPSTTAYLVPCLAPMETKTIPIQGAGEADINDPKGDAIETIKEVSVQSLVDMPVYPTKPFGGLYCVPDMKNATFEDSVTHGPLGGLHQVMGAVGSFRRAWPVLLGVAVLAIVLGYTYLYLLKCCAERILDVLVVVVVVLFAALGAFFLFALPAKGMTDCAVGCLKWEYQSRNPLYEELAPEDVVTYSLLTGGVLLLVAIFILTIFVCWGKEKSAAIQLVKVSSECIAQTCCLRLQPLLEAINKIVILLFAFIGLTFLLSAGKVDKTGMNINGQKVKGLYREFEYDPLIPVFVVIYIIGVVWLLEVCAGFGQYITSKCCLEWLHLPIDDSTGEKTIRLCFCCDGFKAFKNSLWHLGSIALGSVLIILCRPLHITLGYVAKHAEGESSNAVSKGITKCCFCCMNVFTRHIWKIAPSAYTVIATYSKCTGGCQFCEDNYDVHAEKYFDPDNQDFLTAADLYFYIVYKAGSHAGSVQHLTGCCLIFSVVGIIGIATICAYVAFFVMTNVSYFSDPLSLWVVENPQFITMVALCMCGMIAHTFMVVFDHSADTLLFGFEWYRLQDHDSASKWCPEPLRKLLKYQGALPEDKDNFGYGPMSSMFHRSVNGRSTGGEHHRLIG